MCFDSAKIENFYTLTGQGEQRSVYLLSLNNKQEDFLEGTHTFQNIVGKHKKEQKLFTKRS